MEHFEVEKTQNMLIFRCKANPVGSLADELVKLVASGLADPEAATQDFVVLDMKACDALDKPFLRTLAQISRQVKAADKHLFSMNLAKTVSSFLKDNGMDGLVPEMDPVSTPPPSSRPAPTVVDVNFINPFITSALNTLEIQCSVKATAGKPFIKEKNSERALQPAIAGVIGLTSKGFSGSIALCFPEKTFLAVMGSMLGKTFTEITPQVQDGAGELLNVIFGGAKRVLNTQGYAIEKAIPTIVHGNDLKVKHLTPSPTIVLPFETPQGGFQIEIGTETPSAH